VRGSVCPGRLVAPTSQRHARTWQTSSMEEVRRTSKGIDYIAKVLKVKKTVTTRAVFLRILHKTG
jgi:hypothetical protein